MKLFSALLLTLGLAGAASAEISTLDIALKDIDGKATSLKAHKGKVMLVVNVASRCGLTRQYNQLQAVHTKYAKKGFTVLGFPCNQFGRQEPGEAEEIGAFCEKNYGVSFPMFEKVDVNGDNAHPVFKFLKSESPGLLGTEAIKWNFTKFLVDRDGNVVKRYAPKDKPEKLADDIEALL